MEGFDPSALPYMASPLDLANVGTGDYLNMLPSMGIQRQAALYDTGDFGG